MSPKPTMHGSQKSDGSIVPTKPLNGVPARTTEVAEGRDPTKGNTVEQNATRT